MADVKPLRTESDYAAALARVDELMDAEVGSPEGEELDILVDLVELYESKHEPMEFLQLRGGDRVPDGAAGSGAARPGPLHRQPRQGFRGAFRQALDHHADGAGAASAPRHSGGGAAAGAEVPSPTRSSNEIQWRRFPLREMAKRQLDSICPRPGGAGGGPGTRPDRPRRGLAGGERRPVPQERPPAYQRQDRPPCPPRLVLAGAWRWPTPTRPAPRTCRAPSHWSSCGRSPG